jgi:hypothetical protein
LLAVFERPTRSDLRWAEIESLMMALGGELREGSGSRMRVRLRNEAANFHRPHPRPEARKAAVEAVRDLLTLAGFAP